MYFSIILLGLLEAGQNERVKSLVKSANLYNFTDSQGQTLLHHAAVYGNLEIIQYLLENGSDVNSRDEKGETPLLKCLAQKHYALAKFLLDTEANVSGLLHWAVQRSDDKSVKLLLNYGANIGQIGHRGDTPLFHLYLINDDNKDRECANIEILRMLLNLGAPLTTCIAGGCFQISPTLQRGSREAVRIVLHNILHSKINFNTRANFESKTILHYIAMNLNPGITEELKPYIGHFDLNILSDVGLSPLREAVSRANVQLVKFLLNHGAKVDLLDPKHGSNALWSAFNDTNLSGTSEDYEKCIELLLLHNIDSQVIVKNSKGKNLTIVDAAMLATDFDKLKLIIAQLAVREKQRIAINELTLSKINSRPEVKVHLQTCRKLLGKKIVGTISVFKLLTASEKQVAKYLNEKKLNIKLMRIRHKQKLKNSYKLYFNILEKRLSKVFLSNTLKGKAVKVICQLLQNQVNESNVITEKVIDYLNDRDMRQLHLM